MLGGFCQVHWSLRYRLRTRPTTAHNKPLCHIHMSRVRFYYEHQKSHVSVSSSAQSWDCPARVYMTPTSLVLRNLRSQTPEDCQMTCAERAAEKRNSLFLFSHYHVLFFLN